MPTEYFIAMERGLEPKPQANRVHQCRDGQIAGGHHLCGHGGRGREFHVGHATFSRLGASADFTVRSKFVAAVSASAQCALRIRAHHGVPSGVGEQSQENKKSPPTRVRGRERRRAQWSMLMVSEGMVQAAFGVAFGASSRPRSSGQMSRQSSRMCQRITRPTVAASMATHAAGPSCRPADLQLYKYPRLVPHVFAKASRAAVSGRVLR